MEAPFANDVALVAIKTPRANLHARTEQWRLTSTTLQGSVVNSLAPLAWRCDNPERWEIPGHRGSRDFSAPGLPQWNNIRGPRITTHFGVWLQ